MHLTGQKILGIDITTSLKQDILEEIRKYLIKPTTHNPQPTTQKVKPFVIFTPNPEIINFAQKDDKFKKLVNTAQINLPDGAGLVWAMKRLFGAQIKQIAGIDFMLELIKEAQDQSLKIGLIGGRDGLAVDTAECLRSKHQSLKIEVFDPPEVEVSGIKNSANILNTKYLILNTGENQEEETEEYFENLVKEIVEKKVDILFVAMGFQKQEYFIHELVSSWLLVHSERTNKLTMNPLVIMAVGGAFGYISGRVPRAPLLIRNIGLEWLFRLIVEPWRLQRQIKGAEFFLRIAFPSFFPIQ